MEHVGITPDDRERMERYLSKNPFDRAPDDLLPDDAD